MHQHSRTVHCLVVNRIPRHPHTFLTGQAILCWILLGLHETFWGQGGRGQSSASHYKGKRVGGMSLAPDASLSRTRDGKQHTLGKRRNWSTKRYGRSPILLRHAQDAKAAEQKHQAGQYPALEYNAPSMPLAHLTQS